MRFFLSPLLWIVALGLSACAYDPRYYDAGIIRPLLQENGPPIRYSLDYPVCYGIRGLVVVPLRIRLWGASIPEPGQVVSTKVKYPNSDGCFPDSEFTTEQLNRVYVEENDSVNGGIDWNTHSAMAVDQLGNGFIASAYRNQLLNAKDLQIEHEKQKLEAATRVTNLAKLGFTYADVVKQDETVTINGMAWHHRLTAMYEVADPSRPTEGKLLAWREAYDHAIDGTHILRCIAHYDAMIVDDNEWIAPRRNLLRKLVQAVRIESMTQAEVDATVTQYRQQQEQNKQDWKRKH